MVENRNQETGAVSLRIPPERRRNCSPVLPPHRYGPARKGHETPYQGTQAMVDVRGCLHEAQQQILI